ncbi:MAG TPA: nitrate reductase, partial [Alcanivorax sp.]|nr:nitrate reductase [Alcanivorax sp.]
SVACYGSGQLLTEDYYVANKLMKGFVGSAHMDTNSRLCMASAVAGYKRAFGGDSVPGCYEDLDSAELLVLVGSNAAWTHPVLYQRMVAAKKARPDTRVVVIDPRRTATCDLADLHLPSRPGADGLLFNGLLAWLDRHGHLDRDYIREHTRGFDDALARAEADGGSLSDLAQRCDLPEEDIETFFRWFASRPRTVTFYSQGINQSATGTDKCNTIINCHLATGRVGKPGASPFSITGQPNAMGGREVGGLANQLAAHMDFAPDDVDRVKRFWNAANMVSEPGLKAVELFQAVASGRIKFIWILSTNPVVSLPEADRVRDALRRCPTVVVSECMADTDTVRLADIKLPARTWGEKNGTVTNSERCISRQRPFLEEPGEARSDWWALA